MKKAFFGFAVLALLCAVPGFLIAQSPQLDDLTGHLREVPLDHETVADLAQRHDLSTLSVLAVNWGLDMFEPQTRDRILLPTAHLIPDAKREGVVVNLAEYRLYYFKDGQVAMTAPVAHGEEGHNTPLGETTILRKKKDPVWTPTASTRDDFPGLPSVVPPGPDNPLGGYAFYLKWPTYLIHGAIDPYAIGRRLTRGCVRLYEADIERLFNLVPVGTSVTVVDQPVKLGWHENELFLEAQPSFDQFEELRLTQAFTTSGGENLDSWITAKAGGRVADLDWGMVRATLARRNGVPTQITNPRSHPVSIIDNNLGF
jgi:L,D-transpeptidase ErfK/SrfK